jgi:metal-sulfur cluster biosynthetic enzyme
MNEVINSNPIVYEVNKKVFVNINDPVFEDDSIDEITPVEIFEYIRNLNDPEHPLTLEQLNVVNVEHISVEGNKVLVQFTPTIPHCSMATLIGLCIRVKLLRSLPSRFKIIVQIYPGSHQSEAAVNKQLNDKERVAAAIENGHLLDVVNKCIANTDKF